ncbi:MAG TPA: serine/threonine-protein kinase [Planctomycetota bacterium]|nr:serine/threonine-protein kinase [Planctomycetota bacterium]
MAEDQQLIQMALSQKYLTHAQLKQAKEEQRVLADRGLERTLWFLVQDLGFVTEEQARTLRTQASSTSNRALEVEGYVIQGRIGSGGMGDVFRGRRADGDEVAIKLLSSKFSNDNEYAARFKREGQATLRLSHPHVTRSLSDGECDGHRYLIMELVNGISLRAQIQSRGKMSEHDALYLMAQMADALGYAWSNGILHRDVKPANIILGAARPGVTEPFCAKLCDFGLAKVWQTSRYTIADLTKSGVALGTPHYMSPEQAAGDSDLDQRSDIYSLGATVYHAVLGETMYNGKSSAVIMYKHVNEALDLQPLRDAGISEELVKLLGRMLAKDRSGRFADWNMVLSETRSLLRARTSAKGNATPTGVPRQPANQRTTEVDAVSVAPGPTPTPAPAPAAAPARAAAPAPASVASTPAVAAVSGAAGAAASAAASPAAGTIPSAMLPGAGSSGKRGGENSRGDRTRLRRLQAQLIVRVVGVSIAIAAVVALAFFLIIGRGVAALGADPASFVQVLKTASAVDGPTTVVLAAGDYRGPWRLGPAHADLRLRAAGPGVRLIGDGHEPLLQLQAGLRNFALEGVTLVPGGGLAIEALNVHSARLEQIAIDGECREILVASASNLDIRGLQGRASVRGIDCDGGSLALDDSFLRTPPPALRARHAAVDLERCRFAAAGTGEALITLSGGRGAFRAVVAEADGCASALAFDAVDSLDLVDVALLGARTGIAAAGSQLGRVDGLTIDAVEVGLSWNGARDRAWQWQGLLVRAAQPAPGLDGLSLADDGARADALKRVPLAAIP